MANMKIQIMFQRSLRSWKVIDGMMESKIGSCGRKPQKCLVNWFEREEKGKVSYFDTTKPVEDFLVALHISFQIQFMRIFSFSNTILVHYLHVSPVSLNLFPHLICFLFIFKSSLGLLVLPCSHCASFSLSSCILEWTIGEGDSWKSKLSQLYPTGFFEVGFWSGQGLLSYVQRCDPALYLVFSEDTKLHCLMITTAKAAADLHFPDKFLFF